MPISLAGRRARALERLAGGGVDPLAADEVLERACSASPAQSATRALRCASSTTAGGEHARGQWTVGPSPPPTSDRLRLATCSRSGLSGVECARAGERHRRRRAVAPRTRDLTPFAAGGDAAPLVARDTEPRVAAVEESSVRGALSSDVLVARRRARSQSSGGATRRRRSGTCRRRAAAAVAELAHPAVRLAAPPVGARRAGRRSRSHSGCPRSTRPSCSKSSPSSSRGITQ